MRLGHAPQPVCPNPEAGIVFIRRQEVALQQAEFLMVNMFSQRVGVGMHQQAVIAVEGGEHAFEQGGRGVAVSRVHRVAGHPFAPLSPHRRGCPGVFGRRQQMAKPGNSSSQRPHRALANQAMVGINDVAEKIDALGAALDNDFVRVQLQLQVFGQKALYLSLPCRQRCRFIGEQYKVVDITQVTLDLEPVFDELVKFIEIHIGEELAGQATNRQPDARAAIEQGFVCRNAAQQAEVSAAHRLRVNRRLPDDGAGNLVELFPVPVIHRQMRQRLVPQVEQGSAVNVGEKRADIEFAVPAVLRLTHEFLQPINGGMRALAFSVGVAIVDETLVPPGFDVVDQPLLDKAVSEGRREDFAQLWIGNGKDRKWLWGVPPLGNHLSLGLDHLRKPNEVSAFLFAGAGFGGALKKLPGDFVFVQGN